ncbi:hypothetical protein E2C01_097576 [Portunus trituberculatus]|uniref:Uncharacterized protein n=1 Tax=Portunus trituberculatus TaxID=210409 RepID=A0A5B7JYZ7_PORTR|nr:hypothetical protein [Portunus trituberculatus]
MSVNDPQREGIKSAVLACFTSPHLGFNDRTAAVRFGSVARRAHLAPPSSHPACDSAALAEGEGWRDEGTPPLLLPLPPLSQGNGTAYKITVYKVTGAAWKSLTAWLSLGQPRRCGGGGLEAVAGI